MSEITEAAVLAALDVLGWPDDRAASAHVEDDGTELAPAGTYWELVVDALNAAVRDLPPRPCTGGCSLALETWPRWEGGTDA